MFFLLRNCHELDLTQDSIWANEALEFGVSKKKNVMSFWWWTIESLGFGVDPSRVISLKAQAGYGFFV